MDIVKKEVAARAGLGHQYISKYYGFCQKRKLKKADGSEIPVTYIVEEPILGGELFDHVMELDGFSEKMCRHFFKQILEAVSYVHRSGYAHRDLKLENILLDTSFNIKLIELPFNVRIVTAQKLPFATAATPR